MNKIFSLDTIQTHLFHDRQVVFTHGAFDLFHIGHLTLLQESKNLGRILIVGVDSDANMQVYKNRQAVFNHDYRMHIVSRLDFVDYVIAIDKLKHMSEYDYFYFKLYLHLKPTFVTYGDDMKFASSIDEKCRLAGIKSKKIMHEYSHLHTSGYVDYIVRRYIDRDFSLYTPPKDDGVQQT